MTTERQAGLLHGWSTDQLVRFLVEESTDLVTVVDVEGKFIFVNAASERILGISPAQALGQNAFDFVHADDKQRTHEEFKGLLASGSSESISIENRQVNRRSGQVRDMLWTVAPHLNESGQVRFLTSIARDVTDEHAIRAELAGQKARLASVLAGMLDATITIDELGSIQDVSNSVETLFGYQREELVGQNIRILMPEPYHSEHDSYLENYRATGDTWILNTTRCFDVVRKDGSLFPCELSVARIDVPEQEPIFCGSFRDISERREAERRLAESEARFRAIFNQEFQFVGLLGVDGTVLEVNETALQAIGSKRDDVVGLPFWQTGWWSYSKTVQGDLKQLIRRAAAGEFVRMQVEVLDACGELRTVDFSLKPVQDRDGVVTVLIPEGRDITEIKRAQERETSMLKALAAVGESAALLAHEIKNPITAINLALRAVADKLGEDHRVVVEDLVIRMQTLEKMMRKTLSFARPVEMTPELADLDVIIDGVIAMLAPELNANAIDVQTEAADGLPQVFVDVSLMNDVFTNLVRNAMDAIGQDGRIAIELRVEQDAIVVAIEDDGPGIPDSVKASLFKPFVTSKDKGSGLGLALCKRIVEGHHGTICVVDGRERGARFVVELPVSCVS